MSNKRRVSNLPPIIIKSVRRNLDNYKTADGIVDIDRMIDGICLEFELFSDDDIDYFNNNKSIRIINFPTSLEKLIETLKTTS